MTAIQIRLALLDDIDAIAPLFDAYRGFYGQPSDIERARQWLHDRLQRAESVVLLATRDDVPAGFTQLYPMFSSVRTARTWLLNDLYVDASARRGGAVLAREVGGGIALETMRDNAPARALYRAAGWHEDQSQWYSLGFTG